MASRCDSSPQGNLSPSRANRRAPFPVAVDRQKLREQIHALYGTEHEAMGERGTLDRLDQAHRRWDLAPTLGAGGVLVFPHAGVLDCGHQIAAVVNACLDSGADRVIVISVLHAFTEEMQDAVSLPRRREARVAARHR